MWWASNKNMTKIHFSPQQLVDCVTNCYGCNGGDFDGAFQYAEASGIVADSDYPYVAMTQTCSLLPTTFAYMVTNYTSCSSCNLTNWMNIFQQGPIGVVMDGDTIQNYESGVVNLNNCGPPNHAVIAVGWNNSVINVRNSWGTSWGENGYFRVNYNATGSTCWITSSAYLPTISNTAPINKCFTPNSTFQFNSTWMSSNGNGWGSITFKAQGLGFQIGFFGDQSTKKPNFYTQIGGWNNTKIMTAYDAQYKSPVYGSTLPITLDPTFWYTYTFSYNYLSYVITITGADNTIFTRSAGAVIWGGPVYYGIAGNGNATVCDLSVTPYH